MPAPASLFDHAAAQGARRFQPGRAPAAIACLRIGAGSQQRRDDVRVPGQCGLVQGGASFAAGSADPGLELSSNCTPAGSSSSGAAAAGKAGWPPSGSGRAFALEQEPSQAPVAAGASHTQLARNPRG